MADPEARHVEVVYATPGRQRVVRVPRVDGLTAGEAVEASRLAHEFPEIARRPLVLGIYGRPCPAHQRLRADDRVEIYRSLGTDPRETRRRLAAEGRTMARPRSEPVR